MRYRSYAVAVVTAAVFISGLTLASASTPEPGTEDNGLSVGEETYLALYEEAQGEFGSAAVGANAVDDGVGRWDAYNVPDSIVARKAAVLDAMLNPPPTPEDSTDAAASTAGGSTYTTTSTPSTGGYSIPESIVQCESGGDYSAVNPSSGAYGAYQILPSTSAAYGCDMSTPAGQDACAAEIYADSGGSAWVC